MTVMRAIGLWRDSAVGGVRAVTAVAASLLCACTTGDDSRAQQPLVDTLPGDIVSVDNTPLVDRTAVAPWSLAEELRIGSVEGGGPRVFGSIYAFAVTAAGDMFILDGQAQEIRHFTRDGSFVRSIGKRGEGPGEFQGAAGLNWDLDGRLLVWDPRNNRYRAFTQDGEVAASYRRMVTGVAYPWRGEFVDDRMVDVGLDRVGATQSSLGTHTRFHFIHLSADFATHDTLGFLEQSLDLIGGRLLRPFSPGVTFSIGRDGFLWFASTHEYRIHKRRLTGDTVRTVSLPISPAPTSDADRDSIMKDFERLPPGLIGRDDVYPTKPLVRRLVVGDEGSLLVFPVVSSKPTGGVFDVFDSAGVYLGRVESPRAFGLTPSPQLHGDYLYGVTKDELDVEYLVRLRIERHQR